MCIFDRRLIVFANRRSKVLEYPPYTPGIAPSTFLVHSKRYRHITDQAVKKTVHAWLSAQPESFLPEGKRKLVQRGLSLMIMYK